MAWTSSEGTGKSEYRQLVQQELQRILFCLGNPEPEIDWYKNNKIISDSRRVKFLFDDSGLCSLVIKEISTKDRGRYKCVASNKKGKVQCSCEMFVEGTSKKVLH